MKKDAIIPIIVLSAICLAMSGALALGNYMARPIIEEAAAERSMAAKKEIIPSADEFIFIEAEGLPKTIAEVYKTDNDSGFIFLIKTSGYGGEIEILCGIDPEGKIIGTTVLSHTETQGLGTVVFEKSPDYIGKDKNLEGIDAVAGSTITSTAYKNGILDAFEAFEIVKGAR